MHNFTLAKINVSDVRYNDEVIITNLLVLLFQDEHPISLSSSSFKSCDSFISHCANNSLMPDCVK